MVKNKKVLLAIFFFLAANFAHSQKLLHTTAALEKYNDLLENKLFFVYPQLREDPIQWKDSIPEIKLKKALDNMPFAMDAQPGEIFVYQLGVWALTTDVQNVQVDFSSLKMNSGSVIKTEAITCYNKDGIDFKGNDFSKRVDVPVGHIQGLWIGIDLQGTPRGIYTGKVTVHSNGQKQVLPLRLKVSGDSVPNHGYNEGKRLSRLNWLNSRAGIDEKITKGYHPVKLTGHQIDILGRTLRIADNGLPLSITSFFESSNQFITEKGEPIVDKPFRFVIETTNKEKIRLTPGKLKIMEESPSAVSWKVINTSEICNIEITGQMEFDGFVNYQLRVKAKKTMEVEDIRLEVPVVKEKAKYMMGLGHEGGLRSSVWKWKWNITKNQDMLWMGAVNGGLRIKWNAENYVRPLVNIYYKFGRLNLPPSWGNEGRGGINVAENEKDVMIRAYSGKRMIKQGETLNYDFELLITPFKPIDRQLKFNDRYYHGKGSSTAPYIENAIKAGANIVNIHHAKDIYPFINYPYLDENKEALKQLVTKSHQNALRMKMYYTTRELTKEIPEFWAFYSLNGEVIFPGPGNECRTLIRRKGPDPWLLKNIKKNYIPAWTSNIKAGQFKGIKDLSVITTPDSRLNNFYIAGLEWMVQNLKIDGIYIDDSALDRFTLRRARKIIDNNRPAGRIDLHSWNHFNKHAGYASCLNLYMDVLPYLDLVWIGEGRDYNRMPDHWLVEVSGIPFGLTGQMLKGGGNPWRGMVYGITNRAGWSKNSPEYLWKFFDRYRLNERKMTGYWTVDCPVQSDNPLVKASVYKGLQDVIIAVANWSDQDQKAKLTIDWKSLGKEPTVSELIIPEISGFQPGQKTVSLNKIVIPAEKGFLILIK